MNNTLKKKLTSDGIGLAHFNKDLAYAHKAFTDAFTPTERHAALTWLYRIAFLRGRAKATREALKTVSRP